MDSFTSVYYLVCPLLHNVVWSERFALSKHCRPYVIPTPIYRLISLFYSTSVDKLTSRLLVT